MEPQSVARSRCAHVYTFVLTGTTTGGSLAQTERLLASPAGTHRQQQPQQLKRPTANVSNGRAYPSSSREQDEPRGGEGGSGGSKASNGMEGEQQQQNGRSEYSVYSRGGPTGSSMHHLSKANRALTLKVKVRYALR